MLIYRWCQIWHYLNQIERTYKKMNEYLMENRFSPNGETLNDEELMIVVSNRKLHTNRKKNKQKENNNYGKESNYNFYC